MPIVLFALSCVRFVPTIAPIKSATDSFFEAELSASINTIESFGTERTSLAKPLRFRESFPDDAVSALFAPFTKFVAKSAILSFLLPLFVESINTMLSCEESMFAAVSPFKSMASVKLFPLSS